jgi:hypothetical protein
LSFSWQSFLCLDTISESQFINTLLFDSSSKFLLYVSVCFGSVR